ncbi:MAG TPA: penicillin-binding transpeptidase domain-containing protein [Polyangiaceae bacterium]|jgi:cell division protein FtsI/penicillin-binding protein 2|nr:penicillin-binding transpeptidase domain-containing protein [Polyangiaceae bacterium]
MAPAASDEPPVVQPPSVVSPLAWDSVSFAGDTAHAHLQDGTPAELTLNLELQRAANQLLREAFPIAGAAILLDVASGRLLAYDQFTKHGHPTYDVLTGEAPSASVFKLVTTAALLEKTKVEPQTPVCFRGGEREILREHLEPPTRGAGTRCATFATALGFSRNAVYAQLVTEHLMRDDLDQIALKLGFNQALPFDLPARVGSLNLPYNDLDFARAAAGFQHSSLSPLGAAHLAYTVALGGQSARMRLVQRAGDYDAPSERELLGTVLSKVTANRLTRMMEVTVHSGTSLEAFSQPDGSSYLKDIRVAGKTGTLQPADRSSTTTWFTGFAPSRDPKVVVTVFLRNDRVWRHKANQVARDLLRVYFKDHKGISDPLAKPHV